MIASNNATGKKKKYAGLVRDYSNYSSDSNVHFVLRLNNEVSDEIINDMVEFEKALHLCTLIKTSNMHLYNTSGKMKKYTEPEEILQEFYDYRLDLYTKRKEYLLDKLKNDLDILNNKVRFINEVINEDIIVFKRKKAQVNSDLKEREYLEVGGEDGFTYLTSMPIHSFTEEKIDELVGKRDNLQKDYDDLFGKTNKQLWINDLKHFEKEYTKYYKNFGKCDEKDLKLVKKGKSGKSVKGKKSSKVSK